ncbi:hypothetical protein [Mycetocola zhujimingii]|uniref:Uncharacterized protein n=1 Tax=Mycetocola zhujimingii TaxID=2079792 RepID=A0A2U1THK7_9MICO|nr:hypothetical protein [Mycetocola zhujimingii]AWB86820.1 hypothetical protein C3E77_09440 [Mycetocola zhujimingii]PWC08368.1 hypothetical protein DF223_03260 [Mycetocola zhujimingii]
MAETRRLELTLHKPRVGWFPRPTVVFNGRGQPAQWGTGTWQLSEEGPTEVTVFLFNRLWKFGHATTVIDAESPEPVHYWAPPLFFGSGRLASVRR